MRHSLGKCALFSASEQAGGTLKHLWLTAEISLRSPKAQPLTGYIALKFLKLMSVTR